MPRKYPQPPAITAAMQKQKFEADLAQIMATTMKLNAEVQRIAAEAEKTRKEAQWHLLVVGAAFFAAATAFAKLFM